MTRLRRHRNEYETIMTQTATQAAQKPLSPIGEAVPEILQRTATFFLAKERDDRRSEGYRVESP
jgi:hypothetical protein